MKFVSVTRGLTKVRLSKLPGGYFPWYGRTWKTYVPNTVQNSNDNEVDKNEAMTATGREGKVFLQCVDT